MAWLALVPLQGATRVASIQVKGNQRYTAADVSRLSGLEIGKSATAADLTAAANRLAATGLFNLVKYTYTTGPAMTVTFDIEEAAWTVPVVFDNVIWLSDPELTAAIREQVPSFDGTAPVNQGAADFIGRALQDVLDAKHLPGHVTVSAQAELRAGDSQPSAPKYLFVVKDPAPKVCAFHVPAASGIAEKDLLSMLAGAVNGDYSRSFVTAASNGTLLDMYRTKGYWRAAFSAPTLRSGECDGVAVALNVTEGPSYSWDRAEWSGNAALAGDVLNKALGMKAGEVADQSRIQSGLRDVHRAYAHSGYITQSAEFTPRLDDPTHHAVFAVAVDEGPQFHMGTIAFPNLRESDAAALAKRWRLKPGDVYDEIYEREFIVQELAPLQGTNGTHPQLETDYDRAAHVVNLRVVFK